MRRSPKTPFGGFPFIIRATFWIAHDPPMNCHIPLSHIPGPMHRSVLQGPDTLHSSVGVHLFRAATSVSLHAYDQQLNEAERRTLRSASPGNDGWRGQHAYLDLVQAGHAGSQARERDLRASYALLGEPNLHSNGLCECAKGPFSPGAANA